MDQKRVDLSLELILNIFWILVGCRIRCIASVGLHIGWTTVYDT